MAYRVRRVVTGHTDQGKSCFLYDGQAESILDQPGRGLVFHELWETDGPLASNEGNEDMGARPIRHHPPHGGTRFRIVEFMPDQRAEATSIAEDFEKIDASDIQIKDADDPTFHRNESVDYNIIIFGEIYAVTEMGETLLKPGDVLIQRGTAHTWHNRSNAVCIFASVMVSAEPLARFSHQAKAE